MKMKNVTLSEPLIVGGKELVEITVRRRTVGDEEDAMQEAIRLDRANNSATVELCLMSKLTRLPYDALRSLGRADYRKIKEALALLEGGLENGEDPMLTAGTD